LRAHSGAWTGDVWKLHAVLREWRPDLNLIALNAHTTGLLLIAGLDPGSTVLADHYDDIVRQWAREIPVPAGVVRRHGAVTSDDPVVGFLLDRLREAREEGWEVARVREGLRTLPMPV